MSAIWDHYPSIPNALSNRMAISMLSGRPHVMTLHPKADWLSAIAPGVFMEGTVNDCANRVSQLLAMPPEQLARIGESAFEWARFRLDQRSLVRFITSSVSAEVVAPEGEPWSTLKKTNLTEGKTPRSV
ncbi:hypothetical protein [Aeromicrobium wangtongii]|uniref:Uncharacterized protein n=1 Tax=Aeromicrobium wangtongii TaxID=2969247 RepID=A0ABY5M7M1_9ACTN|nr:hypothetical protein [Aeromicrobium wangtongii]MCD9199484.1 hypothetical protein [Aeromicrobium wangtongii]UUP13837.1 hypothetical protein NQV15_00565 [Aeromicrobium wangtongii]